MKKVFLIMVTLMVSQMASAKICPMTGQLIRDTNPKIEANKTTSPGDNNSGVDGGSRSTSSKH